MAPSSLHKKEKGDGIGNSPKVTPLYVFTATRGIELCAPEDSVYVAICLHGEELGGVTDAWHILSPLALSQSPLKSRHTKNPAAAAVLLMTTTVSPSPGTLFPLSAKKDPAGPRFFFGFYRPSPER